MDPHDQRAKVSENAYAFLEGKFVPLKDAKISIMTHAFLYGSGIFEGIRGYYSPADEEVYVLRLLEHFNRMRNNAHILMMEITYTSQQLAALTTELIRKCGYREDVYIRPMAYKSAQRIGLKWDKEHEFMMFTVPMGSYLTKDRALNCAVSSWRRIQDNAIPPRAKVSGSYVNVSLAANEAREIGFDEGILLNEDGTVSEAAGMNIFLVRGGKLITTPVYDNVLEGITRASVFEIAGDLGIAYEERTMNRSELYASDEVFICGTGAEISAVGSVDRRKIGDGSAGPVTKRIQDVFFDAVRGKVPRYKKWLTPVWNR